MNAVDFEYDGRFARDYGLVMCYIDSSGGVETLGAGCEVNLNTVPIRGGRLHLPTEATYDSVLETTFQMCKYDCGKGVQAFTKEDLSEIARWLCQNDDKEFRIISDNEIYDYVHFEGRFTMNNIVLRGEVIGIELHFISNRPFALGDPVKFTINADTNNFEYIYKDISDEVGFIYPQMKIYCPEAIDGDLTIHNSIEDRTTIISNCLEDETITISKFLHIESDKRPIQNDFNYEFFRIANSYCNNINVITVSHPCKIYIEYTPIVKGVSL